MCDLELGYHAEKALTMLGMLYQTHRMFDKFLPTAELMGTHAWQRITTMSETAENTASPNWHWRSMKPVWDLACTRTSCADVTASSKAGLV